MERRQRPPIWSSISNPGFFIFGPYCRQAQRSLMMLLHLGFTTNPVIIPNPLLRPCTQIDLADFWQWLSQLSHREYVRATMSSSFIKTSCSWHCLRPMSGSSLAHLRPSKRAVRRQYSLLSRHFYKEEGSLHFVFNQAPDLGRISKDTMENGKKGQLLNWTCHGYEAINIKCGETIQIEKSRKFVTTYLKSQIVLHYYNCALIKIWNAVPGNLFFSQGKQKTSGRVKLNNWNEIQ